MFSNYTVNGVYVKMTDKCDSNEVFRQSDNYTYLYHIGGDQGYWMFREEYSCTNNDTNNGLVRVQSDEANPGDIQAEWEEYTGSNWSPKSDIEVTCYGRLFEENDKHFCAAISVAQRCKASDGRSVDSCSKRAMSEVLGALSI